MLQSLMDIEHAFYINLAQRQDRKEHCEKQMELIGVKAERFNAIKLNQGALGCSLSHLKCLEDAKSNGCSHVFVCEDDILFLDPVLFKSHMNKFLETRKNDWDVILLAGNVVPPYLTIDDTCIRVKKSQTTTGYIVNGHYIDKLIENIREGIELLMKNPTRQKFYAIDQYWFKLQEKDKWYLITPLTVIQREDYSDIEEKIVNYKKIMTEIDKPWLFKIPVPKIQVNTPKKPDKNVQFSMFHL